jgi:uncharacterized membrane protein
MYQEIKDRAKAKIKNKVLFLFFISFIPLALSSIFGTALPFLGLFVALVGIIINYGVSNIYLKVARIQPAIYKDVSVGFVPDDVQKYLVTALLAIMWIFLYSLLLIIPGIIKAYEYSQIFYIALDKPTLTPKEILAESSRIMNGSKTNLFILQLSFIGWALLVVITIGIANIYVIPFYQMALTEFYLQLNHEV